MNCANHPDVPAIAYCRTCGKALCGSCTRDVQGVIYCETCLAERLHGVHPPVATPGAPVFVAPVPGYGPSPALAGILSMCPGLGTVYTGQYVKGFAYMGIFVFLLLGTIHVNGLIFGLSLGFFCVYQIIDAVRTAHAIRMGIPVPDPLGVTQIFGPGDQTYPGGTAEAVAAPEAAKVPTGAVVLIILGVLFLLQTAGWLGDFGVEKIWPLILIGLGVWLYAKRQGLVGTRYRRNGDPKSNLMGPAVLVTIGVLFLIQGYDGPSVHHTWPVFLVVLGVVKLLESKNPPPPPFPPMPPTSGSGTSNASATVVPSSSSEVSNG